MPKGYRVHFVGLPSFAAKIARHLSEFDSENTYKSYDTYFSKKELVKCLLEFNKADLIYSMNGSLLPSGIFDKAIRKKIPLVMHWMGTDVLKAIKAKKDELMLKQYAEYAHHATEVSWLQQELLEVDINAQLIPYVVMTAPEEPPAWGEQFEVLTYLGKDREKFYGWHKVRALAKALPAINFNIVGTQLEGEELPKNVTAHGWVNNMDEFRSRSTVLLRLTEHDGLANTVLEALSWGRYVLFTYNTPGCKRSEGVDSDARYILELWDKFANGPLDHNETGMNFIKENFESTKVLEGMKKFIQSVIEE